MISSLVHILIVTPVLFAWLRERELRLSPNPESVAPFLTLAKPGR